MATPNVGEAQPPEASPLEDYMSCLSKKFRYKYRAQQKTIPRESGSSKCENMANLDGIKAPSSTSSSACPRDLPLSPNSNRNHGRKNVLQTSPSMNRLTSFTSFKEPPIPCPRVPLVVKQPTSVQALPVKRESPRMPGDDPGLYQWRAPDEAASLSGVEPVPKALVIVHAPAALVLPRVGPPPGMFRPWEDRTAIQPMGIKPPHPPLHRTTLMVPNAKAMPESSCKSDQGANSELDSEPDQEFGHSLERVSTQKSSQGPSQNSGQDLGQTPSQEKSSNGKDPDPAQDQGQRPLHVKSQSLARQLKPAQEVATQDLSQDTSQEKLRQPNQESFKKSTQGPEQVHNANSSFPYEEDSDSAFDLVPLNLSLSLPTSPRERFSDRGSTPPPSEASLTSTFPSLAKKASSLGSPSVIEEPSSSTTPSPPRSSAQPNDKDIVALSLSLNDVSSSTTSQAGKSAEVPSTSRVASRESRIFPTSDERSGRKPVSCAPRLKSYSLPSISGLESNRAMEIPQTLSNRKRAKPRRMSGGITFHPHPYVDRQMRSSQNVVLHKTNQYFDCPLCTKSYYTQKDLDQHVKHKHMLVHPK